MRSRPGEAPAGAAVGRDPGNTECDGYLDRGMRRACRAASTWARRGVNLQGEHVAGRHPDAHVGAGDAFLENDDLLGLDTPHIS